MPGKGFQPIFLLLLVAEMGKVAWREQAGIRAAIGVDLDSGQAGAVSSIGITNLNQNKSNLLHYA
jgi:hypothetical protein